MYPLVLLALGAAHAGTLPCPHPEPAVVQELGAFGADRLVVERSTSPGGAGVEACVVAAWVAKDGTALRQPLLFGESPEILDLRREEDTLVVVTAGGPADPAGTRLTTRFAWHPGAQRFLPGEVERDDPVAAALDVLDAFLDDGDFLGARAHLARVPLSTPELVPEVQARWLRATWAAAREALAEGRVEEATRQVLAHLAQPPRSAEGAPRDGFLVVDAATLLPGGTGRWMLPLDPDVLGALEGCGRVLQQGGEEAASLEVSRVVIAIRPDWVDVQLRVADALWEAGREDEARVHYRTALAAGGGAGVPERVRERAEAPVASRDVVVEEAP